MDKEKIREEIKSKNKALREELLKEKSLRVRQDFLNIWDYYYDLIGQLVISDSWTIARYLGMAQDSEDYYHVLLVPGRGIVYSSCVGGCTPLKGYIINEDYERMERIFDLNVPHWKNNVLKTGSDFSDSFGGPLYQKQEDLILVKHITEEDLLFNGFEKMEEPDPVFNQKGYIRRTEIKTPEMWPSGKKRELKYTHEYFLFDPEMQEILFTGVLPTWRCIESSKQLEYFITKSLEDGSDGG